jgi:hypothetical protein
MPVAIFFACLDIEQKSSSLDGHYSISKKALENLACDSGLFPANFSLINYRLELKTIVNKKKL